MIKFYKREIGEGGWAECSYEEYLRCEQLPEMDTNSITTPDETNSGANMYTISDFENDVQAINNGVGTEAFDIKSSITSLFAGIKNYFHSKQLGLDKPLIVCDAGKAKDVTNKYNYTDVMDKLIFQPQRLNCSYKELQPTLDLCTRYMLILEQAMPSVLTTLANLRAGDKVSIYSTSAIITAKNKTELTLQKAFNGKDTTEAVFSTRFESMTQYQAAYMEFNTLVRELQRRNPHQVRLNVDRVAELAEGIHTATAAGELELSGAAVKQLGEMLLALARAVDVYSVAITVLIATGSALDNTTAKLLTK